MSLCVFLGPSMPLPEARAILEADYQPPAAMGDVVRALARGCDGIAVIDGVFERVPSVWHKEILLALSRGVPVFGAASMGALRAAECHAFGMIGVGEVFEAFRDGALEDDDEVAVAHADAEHGYRCLSDAMVNIRRAVREATARGLLSSEEAERLVAEAKSRFYADRHWVEIVRAATWLGDGDSRLLLAAIPTPPDVKRADARALLTRLKGRPPVSHVPGFDLEATGLLQSLLAKECPVLPAGGASGPFLARRWMLASHLRLLRADRGDLGREALGELLVATLAARTGIGGSFLRDYALCGDVNALNDRLDLAAAELARRLGPQLEPFFAVALARRGQLDAELGRVARKWAHIAALGLEWPQPRDAGVDLEALGDWYERELAPLDEGGEAHARSLGFASWEEFMAELVAELLVRQQVTA